MLVLAHSTDRDAPASGLGLDCFNPDLAGPAFSGFLSPCPLTFRSWSMARRIGGPLQPTSIVIRARTTGGSYSRLVLSSPNIVNKRPISFKLLGLKLHWRLHLEEILTHICQVRGRVAEDFYRPFRCGDFRLRGICLISSCLRAHIVLVWAMVPVEIIVHGSICSIHDARALGVVGDWVAENGTKL